MLETGFVILVVYLAFAGLCFWWAENPFHGTEYKVYGWGMWVASVLMAHVVGEQLP